MINCLSYFLNYLCQCFVQVNTIDLIDKKECNNETIYLEHIINFPNTKKPNIKYIVKDGLLEDKHYLYDKYGKTLSISNYSKGILHGDTIDYNVFIMKNGEIKQIKRYIRNYINGIEVSTSEEE